MLKDFQLRYNQSTGLNYGIVRATSLTKATELGREWCLKKNYRFCEVTDPLLVTEVEEQSVSESDRGVPTEPVPEVAGPSPKKKG
jgi:hypothetical protein